jgi:putative endonuclease
MKKQSYIYIITNFHNTVFYIGVTNNLERRYYEHKNKINKGFSERYKLNKLVYFESYENIKEAILREKQLKNWHREWKLGLIKGMNPNMKDLSVSFSSPNIVSKTREVQP